MEIEWLDAPGNKSFNPPSFMKHRIRFVQQQLNLMGLQAGTEDGILGPQTLAALNRVEGIHLNWSKHRKVVCFIKNFCDTNDLERNLAEFKIQNDR